RLYYMVDLAKIERYERESLLWYDEHVTVSQRDALILRNWLGSARVVTIPNGVDTDYFFPGDEPEQPYSMLFVGSFGLHPANIDAALHLSRSIFPLVRRRLPQATLTIAGSGPPRSVRALAGDGVQVVADPPDIRPYMSRASLVVLPLRSGAGTKVRVACAMAMGKAVLGTPVALEGIDVVAGEHAAVESEETFADAAVELLKDRQRRAVIGRRAREFAVTRLDWRVVGRQAMRFYEQVPVLRMRTLCEKSAEQVQEAGA
ncbi:MAG: glycosyltransferase, partial [Armatimonadota bacterium]|nr:glycosyltransferase [Armatimonadota bacterium]